MGAADLESRIEEARDRHQKATDLLGNARETLQLTDTSDSFLNRHGETILNGSHIVLDVAGFIPVVGIFADVASGALYAAEGDYTNAAISVAAAIPIVGDAAAAARGANKIAGAANAARSTNNAVNTADSGIDTVRSASPKELTEQQRRNQERWAWAKQFETDVVEEARRRYTHVWTEVTVVTPSGVATRPDFIAWDDRANKFYFGDAKSSAGAPLTEAQSAGYPDIEEWGATVVGKGKPGLPSGYVIPATPVTIIRPESDWW